MKLAFAGTGTFAVPALRLLCAGGRAPAVVYTAPDRPAGRGRDLRASPVKRAALDLHLDILQPAGWRDGAALAHLVALGADVLVVTDYGFILPPAVLAAPRLGAINVHGSDLPRWRGAAPVARALLAGDTATGVCVIAMDAGVDTGPLLVRQATPILAGETAGALEDRLAAMGAAALLRLLDGGEAALTAGQSQPAEGACYAAKLRPEERQLDWQRPAVELARQVRGLYPAPLAHTHWRDRRVRVHAAHVPDAGPDIGLGAHPGQVVQATRDGVVVATGAGQVCLTRLQLEGGRPLDAGAFLSGHRIASGDMLGTGAPG